MKIYPIIALMVPILFTGCGSSSHKRIPIPFPSKPINNRVHHRLNHQDIGSPMFFDNIKKEEFTKIKEKSKKNKGIDKQPLCFLADEKFRYPKDYEEEQDQIKKATENSLETYKEEISRREQENDILKKIS